MSRKAFTLAEILITLTVIGVVAALTIPTLLQNTNQAEFKTALKREFADLSQATLSIKNDLGGSFVNAFSNDGSFKNAYRGKLSYIKECSSASTEGCWHAANTWYQLNGIKRSEYTQPGLILNNGVLVDFYIVKSDCSAQFGSYSGCGGIEFDVNGFKTPNTIGKDIFGAHLTDDGLIPYGSRGYFDPNDSVNGCLPTARGWGCAAKYLYE